MKHTKRLLALAVLLAVLLSAAAGAEPRAVEEGQVLGHGDPEVWLMGTSLRPTEDMLRTTAEGLAFIKSHEGFSSGGYSDNTQVSIGYGSSTGYAEKYGFPTDYITRAQAHELLVCVVYELEQSLNSFLTANRLTLTDPQYDALISFTYNLGTGWLSGCRLSRHLVNGYTYNQFASAMGIWCHVGSDILQGLVNRRLDEIVLFLDGKYDRSQSALEFCTLRYTGSDSWFDNDIDFYEKGKPYGSFSLAKPLDPSTPYLVGWFTQGGARITEQTVVAADLTVSPRWSATEEIPTGTQIRSLTVTDESGNALTAIPDGSFCLSAEIYKAEDAGETVILFVTYTATGRMIGTDFMKVNVPPGTTYTVGTWVKNTGSVGRCKVFLMSSLEDALPLTPAVEITK